MRNPSSPYRFGCGKKFQAYVPRGYDVREITVTCGTTSPSGDPWQCDYCARLYQEVHYREDAEMHGERYDEED